MHRVWGTGGLSPWRAVFSGVTENLRKVVILGVTPDEKGFGPGGSNAGQMVVVVGDNGRILYTNDGGNVWQKLERVTPEHLVSIQFNAFDDFFYNSAGNDLTPEYSYFEETDSGQARHLIYMADTCHHHTHIYIYNTHILSGQALPFGNGIATGSVLYDWLSLTGDCGFGSPNTGAQVCIHA